MLKRMELLEGISEKYHNMLKEVNIANFTKCVAAFGGIKIKEVPDRIIKTYLHTWAKNKYKYYKMLGNKLYIDRDMTYDNPDKSHIPADLDLLAKKFPIFAPWLIGFAENTQNKIENRWCVDTYLRSIIDDIYPNFQLVGSTITHFFAHCLNAPETLVTEIGKIYEGDTVEGHWTISIDPVDMMLASENPYKWQSCYRLTVPNESSHADGCLAAVLDTSSLITYLWTKEGDYSISSLVYSDYLIKNIRYKRIRQWITISPSMQCIHFNKLYPTSEAVYGKEFTKELRSYVEEIVAEYNNMPNTWRRNTHFELEKANVCRKRGYGYEEFNQEIFINSCASRGEFWYVYDEPILSPDGCGEVLPGADNDYWLYNGDGFIFDNFSEDEGYYEEEYEQEGILQADSGHITIGPSHIVSTDEIQLASNLENAQILPDISTTPFTVRVPDAPQFTVNTSDITDLNLNIQTMLNRTDIECSITDNRIRINTISEP